MKYPTSFYNKAIFRSDLKRFGFVGIVFFVLTFLINNVGVIPNMLSVYNDKMMLSGTLTFIMPNPWDIMMVFFIPVIMGVVLFRYLQEENALSSIHAFPVSRKALFMSHFMAFGVIYGLPVLGNILISMVIIMAKGYPIGYVLFNGFIALMVIYLGAGTVFSITVLFGMMVGSSVLQAVLTYIMMGIPVAIVELTRVLISWTLRGYPHVLNEFDWQYFATPYYSIIMMMAREGMEIKALLVVCLFLLVSLALSYLLYMRRDLERHHDLITFDFAKVGFVALLTILITLALSTLIGSIMGDSTLGAYVGLVVGSLLGYFVTKMIAEKTVSVLIYYKQALIVLALFVFALIIIDLDLLGYESRIPDDADIAYVYYSENSTLSYDQMIENDQYFSIGNQMVVAFKEPASIKLVKDLHRYMIEDVQVETDDNEYEPYYSSGVNIIYVLNNGRKLQRSYMDYVDDHYIKAIHESREYKDFVLKQFEENIYAGQDVEIRLYGNLGEQILLSKEEMAGLFQVYAVDYRNLGYYEEISYDSFATIEISTFVQQGNRGAYDSYETRNYATVPIWPSFENTKKWLIANEYGEHVPNVDEVVKASIFRQGVNNYGYDKSYETRLYNGEPTKEIVDEALIKDLFELGYDYSKPLNEGYVITFYYEDYRAFSFRRGELPSRFDEYINQY